MDYLHTAQLEEERRRRAGWGSLAIRPGSPAGRRVGEGAAGGLAFVSCRCVTGEASAMAVIPRLPLPRDKGGNVRLREPIVRTELDARDLTSLGQDAHV